MAKAQTKIVLSPSRDIPFDKLVLSQSNVRRVKNGVTIENLADSIARRGLLHGLNVRPQLDEDGNETGTFEVPAGGRRYSALGLLVKRKRLAKDALVPCVVKSAHDPVLAEEDSLAENNEREPLHPLDEFRGMKTLSDKGECEEAIAAHFRVTAAVVRQRLKLASVSPKLHEVYVAGDMTLDQLMAFSISDDHGRQEELWDMLAHSSNRSPSFIRYKLTEDKVEVSDKRVRFIGLDAYLAAGGTAPMRDLFEPDDGGWISDVPLVDRLVAEKLEAEADRIKAEGWKWVEALVDLDYGYDMDCRTIAGVREPLTEEAEARIAELRAETDALQAEWDGRSDVPAEVEARSRAIDVELAEIQNGSVIYDPEEQARAGVFVCIDDDGTLYVDRGYVRPEDEPEQEAEDDAGSDQPAGDADDAQFVGPHKPTAEGEGAAPAGGIDPTAVGDDEDEGIVKPLPDRLVAELTASRTLALQDAFAQSPSVAFLAVLHAMVLQTFYYGGSESCLSFSLNRVGLTFQSSGERNSSSALAIKDRHQAWKERLPESGKDTWDAIQQFDANEQAALFAHCAAYTVNAQWEPVPKHGSGRVSAHTVERRIAHADVLAQAVGLDMIGAGWRPTFENYLNRVTRPRILEAVTEAKGPQTAGLIDHLKKADMAREAERLLADTDWLPEPLRMPGVEDALHPGEEPATLPAFLDDDGEAPAEPETAGEDEPEGEPALAKAA